MNIGVTLTVNKSRFISSDLYVYQGTRQPYFPIGGPVPPVPKDGRVLSSSRWGGMEVGENMLYGVQVLDGQIHEECGVELLKYLQSLPERSSVKDAAGQVVRCPVGIAVRSPAFGPLKSFFRSIVHTVAPFYGDLLWENKLTKCYINSFKLLWEEHKDEKVATVLLGAGCRGIPISEAARVAAKACVLFSRSASCNRIPSQQLHFVLREDDHCQLLCEHLENECFRL